MKNYKLLLAVLTTLVGISSKAYAITFTVDCSYQLRLGTNNSLSFTSQPFPNVPCITELSFVDPNQQAPTTKLFVKCMTGTNGHCTTSVDTTALNVPATNTIIGGNANHETPATLLATAASAPNVGCMRDSNSTLDSDVPVGSNGIMPIVNIIACVP